MPAAHRENVPGKFGHSVIDGSHTFARTPQLAELARKLYSKYKAHHTVLWQEMCSPNGFIIGLRVRGAVTEPLHERRRRWARRGDGCGAR